MSPRIDIPMERIQDFCRRWRIVEFSFFGSVLREDFRPDSDIDVLVSFDPESRWNLFDLVEMQSELEKFLGRKVDLVEKESIRNPFRRDSILKSTKGLLNHSIDRDPAYLWDIICAAKDILSFIDGVTWAQYSTDKMLQSAVEHELCVIGRVARKISESFCMAHPEINWEPYINLPDIIMPGSGEIPQERLWYITTESVPGLFDSISYLIPKPPSDDEPPVNL